MSGVLKKSTSWREKAPKRKRYWDSCACATIWTSFTEGPTRIELCVAYLSFRQNYCVWHNLILKFQFIFLPIFTRHPFESCFPPDSHLFPLNGVIFCDSFFFQIVSSIVAWGYSVDTISFVFFPTVTLIILPLSLMKPGFHLWFSTMCYSGSHLSLSLLQLWKESL